MNIEEFRAYCLSKKGVTEELPFGPTALTFKVMGKLFALTNLDSPEFWVNLKCDPDYAEELRADYASIRPGYHMNKKHWNSVYVDEGEVEPKLLQDLTDHSYELVVSKLTKKLKLELAEMDN